MIQLYEVDPRYIQYLSYYEPRLFHNKQPEQIHTRKYIGIVLHIHGLDYFAPLSSYKEKHQRMKENIDFIKVKDYAVINLNNMFPVSPTAYHYVDIQREKNVQYRALLRSEYRYIKSIEEKITKNAAILYNLKLRDGNTTALTRRCNDFAKLEEACLLYGI